MQKYDGIKGLGEPKVHILIKTKVEDGPINEVNSPLLGLP